MTQHPKNHKSIRGSELDARLDHELAMMLTDGFVKSPISYSALTARLSLNSRSTLHTTVRKEKIQHAIALQLEAFGAMPLKAQRKSQVERILHLESRIISLQAALDQQIEMMCRVVANATARGWDVEHLLQPLMPNNRNLAK